MTKKSPTRRLNKIERALGRVEPRGPASPPTEAEFAKFLAEALKIQPPPKK